MDPEESRQRGRDLEALFQKAALTQGFLARKMPLSCRAYGHGGRTKFVPVKSELDWQLLDRNQRIAFLDTKSTKGDRFAISALKPHQIETAATLNDWGFVAGFFVWFREIDRVCYVSGKTIKEIGSGSFGPEHGLLLGTGFEFRLGLLFQES